MTKSYCDLCGHELLPVEHNRLRLVWKNIKIEVMYAVDGTWNKGHVCHTCIRAIVIHSTEAHDGL